MPILPLVGGQDVLTPTRIRVGDTDSNDYEFSDTDLIALLVNVMRAYSNYNPYVLNTTIALVADQSDYALPAGVRHVISHDYRIYAGISSDSWIAFYNALAGAPILVPYTNWSDETLTRIRHEFTLRYDEMGAGQVQTVNYETSYAVTQYLRLAPTPTASGDTFTLRYSADHPLQNNNYFTVPTQHAPYVQKLLEAEIYDVRANKMSSTATDFTAGTSRIRFDKAIDALRARAASLRQEVDDALNKPTARIG